MGRASNELSEIFESVGARGFVHARDLQTGAETGLDAGELVVLASVFKIPVLLELARQGASGQLALTERARVPASGRAFGSTGISAMMDDVEVSLRDLALLMMSVSDNTATDVIIHRVGLDAINAMLLSLGLRQTVLAGDCREVLSSFAEDVGVPPEMPSAQVDAARLSAWRALDPARAPWRSTPAEITRLLELIWKDRAGPPHACAEVRRIMALQLWPHRLTSGFPDGVRLAAKTGTLPGIRNEAGVVTYPDGKQYAVAVFTRARTYVDRRPDVDASIGRAAFCAVESLRE